jgi:hypothetical protein
MKHGPTLVLLLVFVVASSAIAQQPNTPNASMAFDGINGPPWPIVLPINVATWNPTITLEIIGQPYKPFLLVGAPAGVVSPGTPTPFGMLDLDPKGEGRRRIRESTTS